MAKKLVYTVNTVDAHLEGNVLVIAAQGATRTGGWTDPELVETRGGSPDQKVFEFVATPPSGSATGAITPISVKYRSGPLLPPFPTSVLVRAETNEEKAPISS